MLGCPPCRETTLQATWSLSFWMRVPHPKFLWGLAAGCVFFLSIKTSLFNKSTKMLELSFLNTPQYLNFRCFFCRQITGNNDFIYKANRYFSFKQHVFFLLLKGSVFFHNFGLTSQRLAEANVYCEIRCLADLAVYLLGVGGRPCE